jgi:two-component system cell cycle response regulator
MRILAVDDDPISLRILAAVVRASGHECLSAADGAEAWELLSTAEIDVVVSDLQMPGLDGLELCRRIREQKGYTYVVLVTSRSDPGEVRRGMQAGADDYLTKPIDTTALPLRLIAAERVTALHTELAGQRAELERLNAQLAAAARIDALTGLRNRRALDEDLPTLVSRYERYGHQLSAVMLDVDHFKAYNDRFGHPAGDRLLKEASAAWHSTLRRTDILGRYGGEEFIVLLPGADLEQATATLERLKQATPPVTTFSAGVATWDGTETSEDLIARADKALYSAKSAGRDRVVAVLGA